MTLVILGDSGGGMGRRETCPRPDTKWVIPSKRLLSEVSPRGGGAESREKSWVLSIGGGNESEGCRCSFNVSLYRVTDWSIF